MFSPDIVESEEFLDMPHSSQSLYFHLAMRADDDGFVQPKTIMRLIGANADDLKVLLGKRFLLPFESGVVVVKHWLIHNMIRADRYKQTRFLKEKNTLFLKENKAYTDNGKKGVPMLATTWQPSDNQMAPQVRLGKVRLGKGSTAMSESSDDAFASFWFEYPKKESKKKCRDLWHKKRLDDRLEDILTFVGKAKETDRWKKGFVKHPATFLAQESWEDDLSSYSDQKESGAKIIKVG